MRNHLLPKTLVTVLVAFGGLLASVCYLDITPRKAAANASDSGHCMSISSVPTTITTSGSYCLIGDLNYTATDHTFAITINADDVRINFNGYKLEGVTASSGALTSGVYASERRNIAISNGAIRGFLRGIDIEGASPYTVSRGHLIEDMRLESVGYIGILVQGQGSVIRNNTLIKTGIYVMTGWSIPQAIKAHGAGLRISNNLIHDTQVPPSSVGGGSQEAIGLGIVDAPAGLIENNQITDDVLQTSADTSWAIWTNGSTTNLQFRANFISVMTNGVTVADGGSVTIHDNVMVGVSTPYSATGIVNAGGNYPSP